MTIDDDYPVLAYRSGRTKRDWSTPYFLERAELRRALDEISSLRIQAGVTPTEDEDTTIALTMSPDLLERLTAGARKTTLNSYLIWMLNRAINPDGSPRQFVGEGEPNND